MWSWWLWYLQAIRCRTISGNFSGKERRNEGRYNNIINNANYLQRGFIFIDTNGKCDLSLPVFLLTHPLTALLHSTPIWLAAVLQKQTLLLDLTLGWLLPAKQNTNLHYTSLKSNDINKGQGKVVPVPS